MTTMTISNKEMEDIIEIVKYLELLLSPVINHILTLNYQ